MQAQLNNRFQSFELSPEEEVLSKTFNELQLARIYNERAIVANEKVNLKYTPDNVQQFLQQEAELQGKMNVLDFLIAEHEAAVVEFKRIQEIKRELQKDE